MKRSWTWTLVSAVGLLFGCGGPPEDVSAEDPVGESEELISQTIIRQLPGGELTQETTYITRAEQLAQIEAREEYVRRLKSGEPQQFMANLVIDSGCAGSSLWLFDQPNRQGRQLCLYKNPAEAYAFIDLGKVVRYITPTYPYPMFVFWTASVRSLWSGEDAGNMATCDTVIMACYSNAPWVPFGAWQQLNDISTAQIPGSPRGPNTVFLEN
ncbi:hypothetical protein [Pyxidicoccus sp. MSG2]|uniref:hypothetical protein n=1 Tax=Pyxidicoccus sp. MSG2 TaxID=2996790 RepID=UPI00226FE331|nr:hypothetical protein [Pyxidicoccus sp. MSG2]MCY1021341.1 hypothetical protein [Pyxidicoccus sp. MSG2]